MFNKSMSKKVMCFALVGSMLSSGVVFAKDSVTKEETVYTTLSSNGTVKSLIVNNLIQSDNVIPEIKDKSSLENIKNLRGKELPQKTGEALLWKSTEKEILYQGETKKELPIDIKITYFLNDKEINAKELAGKSGKVKIKIELENKNKRIVNVNGKSKTLYTPLSVATVLILPEENFSNIETNAGLIENVGSNRIVTFASIPGMMKSLGIIGGKLGDSLPDNLEITTDVSNFKMAPIYMVATPELPNIDTIKAAKSLDDLGKGVDALKTGTSTIVGGVDKLDGGLAIMQTGITEMNTGLNRNDYDANGDPKGFKNGMGKLNKSVGDLNDGLKSQLVPGVASLYEGVQELDKGISGTLVPGTTALVGGVHQIDTAINDYNINPETKEKMPSFKAIAGSIQGGLSGMKDGFVTHATEENLAGDPKNSITDAINALNYLIQTKPNSDPIIQVQMNALVKGLVAQTAHTTTEKPTLYDGIMGLNVGAEGLYGGITQLGNQTRGAVKGADQFKGGVNALSEKVHGTLLPGVGKLNAGISGVSNIIDTQMVPKTGKLSDGAASMSAAVNDKLMPGVTQLKAGSGELSKGVKKFNEEGILKLHGTVSPLLTDVKDVLATKDELVKLSEESQSFTGKEEGMAGNVKFIIKTEEIKVPEVKETKKVTSVKKEKRSLWQKIKSLF